MKKLSLSFLYSADLPLVCSTILNLRSAKLWPGKGFSLEHPQGVGIVGIVGTVGIVGIVGIEFCRPEPRPTTPSVLVDI